jgi:hypothetical protein
MSLALAVAGPSAYWYLARATGVVSLLLLTASVVLGVLGPLRVSAPRWPRFAIDSLHRDVSLLVVLFLAIHIITSVLDTFTSINLINSVIPFTGGYRPLWLGFGALSFDLIVALVITSLVRRRLGYRVWQTVHWLSYVSWPVAVLHGLGTGSDTKSWWSLLLTAACVMAVLVAVWWRIQAARAERLRVPALLATVVTPLGLAVFTLAGPLQHGWARKAGTPTSLLVPTTIVSATRAPATQASPGAASTPHQTLKLPFTAQLAGTVSQSTVAGGAIVDLSLRLYGGVRGRLRIRLAGAPIEGGGLSLTGSQVDLQAAGLPTVMVGRITSLVGSRFDARVRGADGRGMYLHADLNIDGGSGTATGSLSANS